ncbi:hypothetical protein [Acaryochloris sp. IP29b_bin.137]|uniref:hypothetical protein n=1 Tax=Acaryochloris sp. IP29b_bin.137 TaxID=2969217 RepID=UPI0026364AB7|nr:hypothetical protein [Acaryochloris sp. IP29b_bin.137]
MAKRRNLKKEKALRNQAYARKFRKRSGSGRFGRRQYNSNRQESSSDNQNEENQENNSDTATASD